MTPPYALTNSNFHNYLPVESTVGGDAHIAPFVNVTNSPKI